MGELKQLFEKIQVGLTPNGLALSVTDEEGNIAVQKFTVDEAFAVAGQLQAMATILIHTQYATIAKANAQGARTVADSPHAKYDRE